MELRHRVAAGHPPGGVTALHLAQYVAADRSGNFRAVTTGYTTMLDHDRTHITRGADRREANEQRMVALLPGDLTDLAQSVLMLVLGDHPNLRSARFAAHGETGIGDALGIGRAALLVDDRIHPVENQSEHPRADT